MRINFFREATLADNSGGTIPGFSVTGPIYLMGDPVANNEAATKRYIDTRLSQLSAGHLTTGQFAAGNMPPLSGDVSTNGGTATVGLRMMPGLTPGNYSKVTVDAKGRVTAGESLLSSDIPDLSWNKITSGKPTTVSGYGITDILSTNGGTFTGTIRLAGAPTVATHAATKLYVDQKVETIQAAGMVAGDIIVRPNVNSIPGFLRCNGATVSKTTYSALYSKIGDSFDTSGTSMGAGQPWRQQYDINATQTDAVTGWTTDAGLPVVVFYSQVVVTKNRVYLLGGMSASDYISTVYTAVINADGTLGAWTTGTPLPAPLGHSQAIVAHNRIYLLGGFNDAGARSTVYTAVINADGTLGAWTTATSLPAALYFSQAVVTKNRVYLIGGHNGAVGLVDTTYTAPINTDGSLGAWTTGTSLPVPLGYSQAIVTKNRIHLLGGLINNNTHISTVYTAPINADGTLGAWTTGVSLPAPLSRSQTVTTKGRVYLFGGENANGYSSATYSAPINADGTLGTWTVGANLVGSGVPGGQAIVTGSKIYLLSGSVLPAIYSASFSGGLNDYSVHYSSLSFQTTPAGQFRLPNLTTADPVGSASFIRF